MSATLNFNQKRLISWKGKTIDQISTVVKKNVTTPYETNKHSYFLPNRLKIYRREIANATVPCTNPRTSITVRETMDAAAATIQNPHATNVYGQPVSQELVYPNNKTMNGDCTKDNPACLVNNARKRLRGNVNKKTVNHTFHDANQRMVNRHMTYGENLPNTVSNLCDNGDQRYVPIYKPSNKGFSVQGGVQSSSVILKRKMEAINTSALIAKTAYGNAAANSLAYGVPQSGYNFKDKIGYPIKCTPEFNKVTGEMIKPTC